MCECTSYESLKRLDTVRINKLHGEHVCIFNMLQRVPLVLDANTSGLGKHALNSQ